MNKSQFVVSVTVSLDDLGTTKTFYFTDGVGFTTKSFETPPNVWVAPGLIDPGNIDRSIYKSGGVSGGMQSSYGVVEIDNSDGTWDDFVNYGIGGQEVQILYGPIDANFPFGYTTVMVLYGQQIIADFKKLTIQVRDKMYLLDKPFAVGRFKGTGGLEGDLSMAGIAKQRFIGYSNYAPVVLIDNAQQIYHVSSSYMSFVTSNFFGTETPYGFIGVTEGTVKLYTGTCSYAQLFSGAPYDAAFYVDSVHGEVYMRLYRKGYYDIRVDLAGTATEFEPYTLRSIAAEAGVFQSLGPTLSAGSRVIQDGEETYLEFLNDACIFQFGYFGFTRLGAFVMDKFKAPDTVWKYQFTEHNSSNFERKPPDGFPAPCYKVSASFGQVYVSNVANINDYSGIYAEGGPHPETTYENNQYLARFVRSGPVVTSVLEDPAKLLKHPNATSSIITSKNGGERISPNPFGGETDWYYAEQFVHEYLSLYGSDNEYITLTCHDFSREVLELDLGDTVSVRIRRFGLQDGKNYRIVSTVYDMKGRKITYGLWGGDITPYVYVPPVPRFYVYYSGVFSDVPTDDPAYAIFQAGNAGIIDNNHIYPQDSSLFNDTATLSTVYASQFLYLVTTAEVAGNQVNVSADELPLKYCFVPFKTEPTNLVTMGYPMLETSGGSLQRFGLYPTNWFNCELLVYGATYWLFCKYSSQYVEPTADATRTIKYITDISNYKDEFCVYFGLNATWNYAENPNQPLHARKSDELIYEETKGEKSARVALTPDNKLLLVRTHTKRGRSGSSITGDYQQGFFNNSYGEPPGMQVAGDTLQLGTKPTMKCRTPAYSTNAPTMRNIAFNWGQQPAPFWYVEGIYEDVTVLIGEPDAMQIEIDYTYNGGTIWSDWWYVNPNISYDFWVYQDIQVAFASIPVIDITAITPPVVLDTNLLQNPRNASKQSDVKIYTGLTNRVLSFDFHFARLETAYEDGVPTVGVAAPSSEAVLVGADPVLVGATAVTASTQSLLTTGYAECLNEITPNYEFMCYYSSGIHNQIARPQFISFECLKTVRFSYASSIVVFDCQLIIKSDPKQWTVCTLKQEIATWNFTVKWEYVNPAEFHKEVWVYGGVNQDPSFYGSTTDRVMSIKREMILPWNNLASEVDDGTSVAVSNFYVVNMWVKRNASGVILASFPNCNPEDIPQVTWTPSNGSDTNISQMEPQPHNNLAPAVIHPLWNLADVATTTTSGVLKIGTTESLAAIGSHNKYIQVTYTAGVSRATRNWEYATNV